MRGLMNLALALNMAGRFKESLSVCDQLIKECGRSQEDSGWAHKAAAYLNLQDWHNAVECGLKLVEYSPDEGFILGYALFELGSYKDCLIWFLHASLNSPHTAYLLTDKSKPKPKTFSEVEDHNSGIMQARSLPRFFQLQSKASRKFFTKFMENQEVKELLAEVVRCDQKHSDGHAKSDRTYFDRWLELKSLAFARKTAKTLLDELVSTKALPSQTGGKKSRV
jgi:tetratricopeptide (TPR) repeat protein